MAEKNTGGAAFPMIGNVGHNSEWDVDQGMSLRDYFAGQALVSVTKLLLETKAMEIKTAVKSCYEIADAMIKERDNA